MRDLSLHILDILQNSVTAGAENIEIHISVDNQGCFLILKIIDDGCGMEEEFLKDVKNPFTTTRTTRKVGMGLSLLEAASNRAKGILQIESQINTGTILIATFQVDHIDRLPLGDIAQTLCLVITSNPKIELVFKLNSKLGQFELDTRIIKETLEGVPINEIEVVLWLKDHMCEGIHKVFEGVLSEING